MSNTTLLPQPIYELVQTLLDVRNTLEDVQLEARSLCDIDSVPIENAATESIAAIDKALDLIKYNE